MKIKCIRAENIHKGIRKVKQELGDEAVIITNRKVKDGVELIVAVELDDQGADSTYAEADVNLKLLQAYITKAAGKDVAVATEVKPKKPPVKPVKDTRKVLPVTPKPERIIAKQQPEAAPVSDLGGKTKNAERIRRPGSSSEDIVKLQMPVIKSMRDELHQLRDLVRCQMSYFGWDKLSNQSPQQANLLRQLTAIGLSGRFCKNIVGHVDDGLNGEMAWRKALGLWARQLPVKTDDILKTGGVIALLGPTGAGKSTTTAKLAAQFGKQHGKSSVTIVSFDNHRIGAHEQLSGLGRLLGLNVIPAANSADLCDILKTLCGKKLVIIDTAGIHQQCSRLKLQLKLFDILPVKVKKYLVLPCNVQHGALHQIASVYSESKFHGCILTKLDEATSLGGVLSVITQFKLPVGYTTQGQHVPNDIKPAKAHQLISKAVALSKAYSDEVDEQAMAAQYGSVAPRVAV